MSRSKEKPKPEKLRIKHCECCGVLFKTSNHTRRYCTDECARRVRGMLDRRNAALQRCKQKCSASGMSDDETEIEMQAVRLRHAELSEGLFRHYHEEAIASLSPSERMDQDRLQAELNDMPEPTLIVLPPITATPPRSARPENPEPLPKSVAGWSIEKVTRAMQRCGYAGDYSRFLCDVGTGD